MRKPNGQTEDSTHRGIGLQDSSLVADNPEPTADMPYKEGWSPDRRPWSVVPPDRLMGKGHPAGDFLEAYEWEVTEERPGFLRIAAHVPEHVLNPRRQLFGGFTPTYVDLVTLYTVRAGPGRVDPTVPRGQMSTINMRVDYYEPVETGAVELVGEIEHSRGPTRLVSTKVFQGGTMAVHALTTVRFNPNPNQRES